MERLLYETESKLVTTAYGQKIRVSIAWFIDEDGALSDSHAAWRTS